MPSAYGGSEGEAIGTIVARPSDRFTSDAEASKYLYCDGSTFSASAYPKLYQILGTTTLPDLRERFLEGLDTAGSYIQAALPNLTGHSGLSYFSQGITYATTGTGAIRSPYTSVGRWEGDSNSTSYHSIIFDASLCSSIYKDGVNTVQPPTYTVRYYIRAK